jgi:D-3-phosphoglycerate dehydrogenase
MLFVTNKDRPGLIGRLGTVLGDAGINIATFNLGRDAPGGNAIALIEIDEEPSEAVLQQVRALPNVVRTVPLRF